MQLSPMGSDKDKAKGGQLAPSHHAEPSKSSGGAAVDEDDPPKIRVVVRKRPINKKASFCAAAALVICRPDLILNQAKQAVDNVLHVGDDLQEKERGEDDIVDVSMQRSYVIVNETKLKVDLTKYMERHQFNFDEALDETVSNVVVDRHKDAPAQGKQGASLFAAHDDKPFSEQRCL